MVEAGRSKLRLGARIGRGGMAEVFAAKLIGVAGFEKDVAVKRVLPRYAGDESFIERFLDEARLAARLSHPNIVQIFELGEDTTKIPHDHYIVMEAVRGANLRSVFEELAKRGEKMPVAIAVHVAQSVCAGLAYAHELRSSDGAPLGIVHRDVSPHNVLLGFEGSVKLIDFGIARARDIPSMTLAGQIVGKPHFMAPEQVLGQNVDGRTDVYALGVVLFELLSGVRPVDGDDDKTVAKMIERGERRKLHDVASEVDYDVRRVVEKALAYAPDDRYENARAFATALLSAGSMTRAGPHDVEALLNRLFPGEATKAWPVEGARFDAKEHTQTQLPAINNEITLVGDVTDPDDDEVSGTHEDTADTRIDRPLPPTTRTALAASRAPIALGAAIGAVILAVVAFLLLRTPAVAVVAASTPVVDAGATNLVAVAVAVADAGAVGSANVDAGATANVDAGVVEAVVEAGVDAGVDAGVEEPTVAPVAVKHAARTGKIVVETRPWSEVRVNGKLLGITPLQATLPVGEHALHLTNADAKLSRVVTVVVAEDKPAVIRVDLRK